MTELLQNRTWRDLRAVARAHRGRFDNNWTKAQAVVEMRLRLLDHGWLKAALKNLSSEAHEALMAIKAHDGCIPRHRFCQAFGVIPRFRPWREDAPHHPWRRPVSIAEHLWFLGLIEVDAHRAVLLPEAVAALLPPVPHPESAVYNEETIAETDQHIALVRDVAALLGTLYYRPVRPLHGKWLPPYVLRAINQRVAQPENLDGIRSELQAERTRFLHYLAEVSELVSRQRGLLLPTVESQAWLSLPYDEAHAALIRAVSADLRQRSPLWRRFRLVEASAPLWDYVAGLRPGQYPLALLVTALRLQTLDFSVEHQLQALCAGPLRWFGIGEIDENSEVITIHPQVFPAPGHAQLHPQPDSIGITLPAAPPLRPLVDLFSVASVDARGLRLDAESTARAVERGLTAKTTAGWLVELTGLPLPSTLITQLEIWEREANRVRMRQVTVLSVKNEAEMQTLRSDWRLRPLLGEQLSPRQVIVRDERTLRKRLSRRGFSLTPLPDDSRDPIPRPQKNDDDPAHLWLAVRLCQAINDVLPLPVRIPSDAVRGYEPALSHRRDTLQSLVDLAADKVRSALRGSAMGTMGAPVIEDVEPERIARAVRQAQIHSGTLRIRYYSPAAGVETERTIAPEVIYERNNATYIEAWCFLDDAQRTFRMDRILAVM